MKVSLIVPMYNELSIIENTVQVYHDYLSEKYPNTRVIRYTPNQGKGNAVKTGMLAASGDIAMFLDADIAYGTDVIERAVQLMDEHPECEMVIGSRPLHPEGYAGYTPIRRRDRVALLRHERYLYQSPESCRGLQAFRFAVRLQGVPRQGCP